MMACKYCKSLCIKYGKQNNGEQQYKCKSCDKTQLNNYTRHAYKNQCLNNWVAEMVKEGCGIRSMARLLKISTNTII
jgi:transposase-like protein